MRPPRQCVDRPVSVQRGSLILRLVCARAPSVPARAGGGGGASHARARFEISARSAFDRFAAFDTGRDLPAQAVQRSRSRLRILCSPAAPQNTHLGMARCAHPACTVGDAGSVLRQQRAWAVRLEARAAFVAGVRPRAQERLNVKIVLLEHLTSLGCTSPAMLCSLYSTTGRTASRMASSGLAWLPISTSLASTRSRRAGGSA